MVQILCTMEGLPMVAAMVCASTAVDILGHADGYHEIAIAMQSSPLTR